MLRQSSNDDDDSSRSFHDDKLTTTKSSSSGSRQSSWSSCLSDELSFKEDNKAARDSGKDSDNDTHDPVGHLSRENFSEGEIPGDHSPGEEVRIDGSSSGLVGTDRGLGGSSDHRYEGNIPIDIPNDQNSVTRKDSQNSTPQNVVKNNIAQDGNENRISLEDDSWIDEDGWIETRENSSTVQSDNQNYIPPEDNVDKRYHVKFRRNDNRSKQGKKMGRSPHDNRSLEAEAHFTFELAKKVLMLAGGVAPSPNSIFGQGEPTNTVTQSICNRALQLCAFELGLFALGLHNKTCFNWLSRTYSAHVSWISTQALELGNVALSILLEKWEEHLTPAEVASIADRASKSNDQTTVQNAAQLALACLSMAHTLNPGYIRSSLTQCKEQGSELLEQACKAVESAADGGGVYPEVLFEVAKLWEYLYEETHPQENNEARVSPAREDNDTRGTHEDRNPRGSHEESHEPRHGPSPQPVIVKMSRMGLSAAHHVPTTPYGYNRSYGLFIPLPTPEQLVQQQITQQVQHLMDSYQASRGQQVPYQLVNAYRVGMLALENLGRRPVDDQPNTILAKNPPFKTEIHWLCNISNKVDISSLQRFCRVAVNSIHSPFVLHDLALEAAGLMAKSNPSQIAFHLRSPCLSPMVVKCLMNYAQCVHQNLQGLPKSEYPEFVELIMHARGAYCMAPGGMTQFNDLLQAIRRSTAKKKDLWQKITTALAQQQK